MTQLTDPARRMPPENCQHCARVRVWITDVTRWHCSRELHMQDKCNDFNPLPNGRRAEPANSIELPNRGYLRHARVSFRLALRGQKRPSDRAN